MATPIEPTSSYRPEDFDTIMDILDFGLGHIDRATMTGYIERLEAIIDTIAESVIDEGHELFPVGPVDIEYEPDGNTIKRIVPPWTWLDVGRGDTFVQAVENYRDATRKGQT